MKKYAILFFLAGCSGGERVENAPKSGDVVQLPAIEWRVVDRPELEAVYRNSGMVVGEGQRLDGFAGLRPDGRKVIYTLPPRYVDDQVTCTLGHEILHVAIGSYHK
jgi:hypothetical protein